MLPGYNNNYYNDNYIINIMIIITNSHTFQVMLKKYKRDLADLLCKNRAIALLDNVLTLHPRSLQMSTANPNQSDASLIP